jgi:hypothetical protein
VTDTDAPAGPGDDGGDDGSPPSPWWRRWWVWAAATLVLALVGAAVVISVGDDSDSAAVQARCVDLVGDVRSDGELLDMDEAMVDIEEATLSRDGDVLRATLTLSAEPSEDVGPNQSRTHAVVLLAPDGMPLYGAGLDVSGTSPDDRGLRARLVTFDPRAGDDSDYPDEVTVPDGAEGWIDGRHVVLEIDADELSALPEDYYWIAVADQSSEGESQIGADADQCPSGFFVLPGTPADEYAATSEGTTTAEPFLQQNRDRIAVIFRADGESPEAADCLADELRQIDSWLIDALDQPFDPGGEEETVYTDTMLAVRDAAEVCDATPRVLDLLGPASPVTEDVVLDPDGLGVVGFGEEGDGAVATLSDRLGPPDTDEVYECQGAGPYRLVGWGALLIAVFGGEPARFSGYRYGTIGRVNGQTSLGLLETAEGISVGSTIEEAQAAYGLHPGDAVYQEVPGGNDIRDLTLSDDTIHGFFLAETDRLGRSAPIQVIAAGEQPESCPGSPYHDR